MIFAKPVKIVGEVYSFLNIFFLAESAQFLKSDIHQQRIAEARIMPLANQSYHGYTHIQRVASGAAAGIRKSIQRDIHLLIFFDISFLEDVKIHALKVNARRLNSFLAKLKPVFGVEGKIF